MALFLDGANDNINITQSGIDTLNGQSAISFSFWIYIVSFDGNTKDCIGFSINNGGTPTGTVRLGLFFPSPSTNGTLRLRSRYNDSTTEDCDSTGGAFSTGQWYHVVGVCDIANDFMAIYINGQLNNSETPSFPVSAFPTSNNACAAIGCTADVTANFNNAYFADVRVYRKAISVLEAQHLYLMRAGDNLIDSLYHRWRLFDSYSGTSPDGTNPIDIGSSRWTGTVIGTGPSVLWSEDFLHSI